MRELDILYGGENIFVCNRDTGETGTYDDVEIESLTEELNQSERYIDKEFSAIQNDLPQGLLRGLIEPPNGDFFFDKGIVMYLRDHELTKSLQS